MNQSMVANIPVQTSEIETLKMFTSKQGNGRQVKKALAVKLLYQGHTYESVVRILDVSMGSITAWKQAYEDAGLEGFQPHHKGRQSYLNGTETAAAVLAWLQQKDIWTLGELEHHLASEYEVERLLARYRDEIERGQVRVLFMDERHLMAGDLEGYVWSKRGQRVEVPIINERERQTYYGALDQLSKRALVEAHNAGNTANTVAYLRFLQYQFSQQRLLLLWDGASYRRAQEIREFLLTNHFGWLYMQLTKCNTKRGYGLRLRVTLNTYAASLLWGLIALFIPVLSARYERNFTCLGQESFWVTLAAQITSSTRRWLRLLISSNSMLSGSA